MCIRDSIITATNLIRIKYPLSSLNYQLSGAHVANFNKIRHIVSEQQLIKNGTQKQNFPIWKIPIRILTAESVTNDIIEERGATLQPIPEFPLRHSSKFN